MRPQRPFSGVRQPASPTVPSQAVTHGTCGNASLSSWETLPAASPIISSALTRDKRSIRSRANSSRLRSFAKEIASCAASRMCRTRTRSALLILNQCGGEDFVPKVTAQIARRAQVHFSAQHPAKLALHLHDAEQTGNMLKLELDQHIDVAVGSKAVREDGPEEREFADVVLPAKPLNPRERDLDSVKLPSHRVHCSEGAGT